MGLQTTPLNSVHRDSGARLVDFAGWEMPIQYAGLVSEHKAVRESVGVFDVSHMGELVVRGPGAAELVGGLVTADVAAILPGRGAYCCACREDGGILDDLIVYRLGEEEVLIVCNASNRAKIAAHFEARLPNTVDFDDESADTALLAIQGPEAVALVQRLLPWAQASRRFSIVTHDGARAARTGYTGEDGFEVFCPPDQAVELWHNITAAGATPAGLAARDTLRLEAALCLYGNDIDESTSPLEGGIGWTIKWGHDFLGREALQVQKANGPTRVLVGFEMQGRGIARAGYPLLDEQGAVVGKCTSGSPAPTLGKNIGLGYVPTKMKALGCPLLVDCRGRKVAAAVVATPFYRRTPL